MWRHNRRDKFHSQRVFGSERRSISALRTQSADEASVASGPTLAPSPHAPPAAEVIEQYDLKHKLPPSIIKAVRLSSAGRKKETFGARRVLLGNWTALEAAARKATDLGFTCVT